MSFTRSDERPRVLGVVPARAGSKGLLGKNLRRIAGRTLVHWAGKALLGANGVDESICTTDSPEIAEEALHVGLTVPSLRPAALSTDEAPILGVLQHLLAEQLAGGKSYSHVALVQPTSPTVRSSDIEEAISKVADPDVSTVVSVAKVPHKFHPAGQFLVLPDGRLSPALVDDSISRRRQILPLASRKAGLVYVFSTRDILMENRLYGHRLAALWIEPERAIAIDSVEDFEEARNYMENERGLR